MSPLPCVRPVSRVPTYLQFVDADQCGVDFAQQTHQQTHLCQIDLVIFEQCQQFAPFLQHLGLTPFYPILAVVILLFQFVGHCRQIGEAFDARQNIRRNGLVLLNGGVDLRETRAIPRIRQHLDHFLQVAFAQHRFLLELDVQLFQFLLA